MNKYTLEKLKKNPHYKISAAQLQDLEDEEREPMTEIGTAVKTFGELSKHVTDIPKHPVRPKVVVHKKRIDKTE